MTADRPVFGVYVDLEERALRGEDVTYDVPTLARSYIEALRAVRPAGPYILGGVSFGGLLAYEMAQQLLKDGHSVRLVMLLDTILPRAWDRRGAVSAAGQGLARWFRRTLTLWPWHLKTPAAVGHVPSGAGLDLDELHQRRERIFDKAFDAYDSQVEPYAGRAIVVRAQRPPAEARALEWHLGWAGLLPHETPVFGVEGDHLGILEEPGASAIARILRQQLA